MYIQERKPGTKERMLYDYYVHKLNKAKISFVFRDA